MKPPIYWVRNELPGRVAVMPRPSGGDWLEDEIRFYAEAGVHVVVSLLEPMEAQDKGLGEEGRVCKKHGIEFISFPIIDGTTPVSVPDADRLVDRLATYIEEGKGVIVHCFGGIGRAPTISACTLIRCGLDVDTVLEQISKARGFPIPETRGQLDYIREFAERAGP